MKTVYKFPIQISFKSLISIHEGAKFLKAGLDADKQACVWALVDTENPIEAVEIYTFGTGMYIPPEHNFEYIDTYFESVFVWHVFLKKPE